MPTEPDVKSPRLSPETLTSFRLGQLIILLEIVEKLKAGPLDIERLAFYDFLSANPFLVFAAGTREHTELQLAGFSSRNLDYQSAPQRFTNRRARLQHDLALLASYGAIEIVGSRGQVEFEPSELGRSLSSQLTTLYADSYRRSAATVIRKLKQLSATRLRQSAREWLRADDLLIDLYDT